MSSLNIYISKRLVGEVRIMNWVQNKGVTYEFRYDVMVYERKRIFYKHIFEDELKRVKNKK